MFSLPAFIRKLYTILSSPEQEEIICWTEDGEGVMIKCVEKLCNEILAQHFRHNNYNSFVRQVPLPFPSVLLTPRPLPCLHTCTIGCLVVAGGHLSDYVASLR